MSQMLEHPFEADEVMAYLDGELEPQRAAALVAHLDHCVECQALTRQFRQISERMLDFQIEASPVNISNVVRAALDRWKSETETRKFGFQKLRAWRRLLAGPYGWAFAFVAIIAIVVSGISIKNTLHRERADLPLPVRNYIDFAALQPGVSGSGDALKGAGAIGKLSNGLDELEPKSPERVGPMIARTASLSIVPANYEEAGPTLERLATSHGGYVQTLTTQAHTGSSRALSETLRVPVGQLSSFLTELRRLGHVEEESQSNSEVTDEYVDLRARLKNARATEQRLIELLGTRTGKLQDVLDAERELAHVRGEIERMEGQQGVLLHRVDYATVEVQLREQYLEQLGSESFATRARLRNAVVEGFGNLAAGGIYVLVVLLAYGPSVLFWLLLVLTPAWFVWRRYRLTGGR